MSADDFYDYILENFDISVEAARIIDNVLLFIKNHYTDESEQYNALCELLDGTIGLSDNELKQVYF